MSETPSALRPLTPDEWDHTYSSTPAHWDEEPHPLLDQLLAAYAPPPLRVLEAGCGLGTTARRLAALGYTVTACDFSAHAVTEARRRTPVGTTVRYEVRDITRPAGPGVFPVVLDRGVLHTCPTDRARRAVAAGMARACAPGGVWLHIGAAAHTPQAALDQTAGPSWTTDETFLRAVGPWFEVVHLTVADFGRRAGVTDWPARYAVLRRTPA